MKRLLLFFVLFSAFSLRTMADENADYAMNMKQAFELFSEGDYESALSKFGQAEQQMTASSSQSDTLYYLSLAMQGRCHNLMENVGQAIDMMQKARAAFEKNYGNNTIHYAYLLDNLCVYCFKANRLTEAEEYSTQALNIFYRYLTNDTEMRAALLHAAETKDALKKYDEAIALQQHALNIISNLAGEHNSSYIDELRYQAKYYRHAGKEDEAKAVDAEIEKLQEECEYGYVPIMTEFDTTEKCMEHRVDAYYCCRYYLSHRLSAEHMAEAMQYIMAWTMATDEVSIQFGEAESKWLSDSTYVYMIAYLAGSAKYALENPEDKNSLGQYSAGVIATLNYYQNHKPITGPVDAFDEYIKLYEKDPKSLYARIEKDYKRSVKDIEKYGTTTIKAEKGQ